MTITRRVGTEAGTGTGYYSPGLVVRQDRSSTSPSQMYRPPQPTTIPRRSPSQSPSLLYHSPQSNIQRRSLSLSQIYPSREYVMRRRSLSLNQLYRPPQSTTVLPRRSPSPSPTYPSREYVMRRSYSPSPMYRSPQSTSVPPRSRRPSVGTSSPLVMDTRNKGKGKGYVGGEVTVEMGHIYPRTGDSPSLSPSVVSVPVPILPPMVYSNDSYNWQQLQYSYDDAHHDHGRDNDEKLLLAGMEMEMEGDESGEVACEVRDKIDYLLTYLLLLASSCLFVCLFVCLLGTRCFSCHQTSRVSGGKERRIFQ